MLLRQTEPSGLAGGLGFQNVVDGEVIPSSTFLPLQNAVGGFLGGFSVQTAALGLIGAWLAWRVLTRKVSAARQRQEDLREAKRRYREALAEAKHQLAVDTARIKTGKK